MEYKKVDDKYFLRLEPNEKIIECLKDFCLKNDIKTGVITGIGAIKSITLGCFNPVSKVYFEKTIPGYMELTSLVGNISRKEGCPYIHTHANASDEDFNVIGGHMVEAVISATCEICITESKGEINRKFSDEIGLNIYDFS